METPILGYAGEICIKFLYMIHGAGIGGLLVLTSNRGIDYPVFKRSSDQGKTWHEASFSVKIVKIEKVDRMFEITRGSLSRDSEPFGREVFKTAHV